MNEQMTIRMNEQKIQKLYNSRHKFQGIKMILDSYSLIQLQLKCLYINIKIVVRTEFQGISMITMFYFICHNLVNSKTLGQISIFQLFPIKHMLCVCIN